MQLALFSILGLCVAGQSYNATLVASITNLLDTLLDNYDYKIRPGHGGAPLNVQVHITVLNMGPISEKDMEFTFDCYFRQIWTDERLKFDGPLKKLSLASKVLKDIWRPDTYIRNGRKSYLHTLTMPNVLLRVSSDGEVYVSQRLTIRARCPMFLKKFPMDTQACPIHIGSLGYSVTDLNYEWKALYVSDNIELSQYKLTKYFWNERNISDIREPSDPLLSTLVCYFVLERQQGFYILQIYTPCTLIVVMSWVSFWLNKEASPARVSLGIMTVLTMSTLGLGGRDDLPKVHYSTAMDIYIVACFGFVFSALVEYAIINFAHIVYVRKSIHEMCSFAAAIMNKRDQVEGALLAPEEKEAEEEEEEEEPGEKVLRERLVDVLLCRNRRRPGISVGTGGRSALYESWARRARQKIKDSDPSAIVDKVSPAPPPPPEMGSQVDTISKFLFPGMYGLFNLLYWSAYLYWIPDEIDSFPMLTTESANSILY